MLLSSKISCEVWNHHFQDELCISDQLLVVVNLFFHDIVAHYFIDVAMWMELNSDIHIVMHSLCFKNQMWQVKSMPPQWIKSIYSFYHVTFNSHFLYAFPISLLFVYCIYGFRRCSSWPPELLGQAVGPWVTCPYIQDPSRICIQWFIYTPAVQRVSIGCCGLHARCSGCSACRTCSCQKVELKFQKHINGIWNSRRKGPEDKCFAVIFT